MPLIENVLTGIWHLLGTASGQDALMWASEHRALPENPRAMYRLRRMLYDNTWAFREMNSDDLILGLRNPTAAAVNFHGFTTWPGVLPDALPIEHDFEREYGTKLISAIQQVWEWSDWQTNKQVYARTKARDGDGLIQVATRRNRQGVVDQVYFHLVDVENLTEFDIDNRGFLTWLRLDIPESRRTSRGVIDYYVRTEVWDKAIGTARVWEHKQGLEAEIDTLGEPLEETSIESMTGTDMLPFVLGKHLPGSGGKRGMAAIDQALVKAHEASRMASRLHQLGYQYGNPDMQLVASQVTDAQGRPLKQPEIKDGDKGTVKLGGSNFWQPPPGFEVKSTGVEAPLEQLRQILADHLSHIQESDLPQLAYYKLASSSRDLSGEALGHMLKPAVELAVEVRSYSEAELRRADMMALTIGAHHDLFDFPMEAYEQGQLDHRFAYRDVIPMTAGERAEVEHKRSQTALNRQLYGYSNSELLREEGLTDEQIQVMETERETTELARGERLMRMGASGGVDRDV